MKNIILIACLILFTHSVLAKTVVLLGQFHLSSNVKTNDIEKSKDLPQYLNQKTIYLILDEWVKLQKLNLIISEGCEGEIDENFKHNFNGWDYASLSKISSEKKYEDILSLIPLKVEAKYKDGIKTICGDNLNLVQKHLEIFSELSGYLGFYTKLKEVPENSKKFKMYKKALEENEKHLVANPLRYAKKKAIMLLQSEKGLILKRNDSFLEKIKNSSAETIAVVIGNRHIEDLQIRLKKAGHKVQLIDLVQETLPKEDLFTRLEQSL